MERTFKVYCQWCQDWHNTEDVEFLNIEEDIEGRDAKAFDVYMRSARDTSRLRIEREAFIRGVEYGQV
jgi:hypothetical protein